MVANPKQQDWYSIGEVAEAVGMSASWVRKMEMLHNISPLQLGKARTRYYSPGQLALLQHIARGRDGAQA